MREEDPQHLLSRIRKELLCIPRIRHGLSLLRVTISLSKRKKKSDNQTDDVSYQVGLSQNHKMAQRT